MSAVVVTRADILKGKGGDLWSHAFASPKKKVPLAVKILVLQAMLEFIKVNPGLT